MGLSVITSNVSKFHYHRSHQIFRLTNYILLGASSSCILLILSLRLIPSLYGGLFILLHALTIMGLVPGCTDTMTLAGSHIWYAIHKEATVITAIFQGSASVLIFTRASEFLGELNSYVSEEYGVAILKLVGGLSILIICLEWVVLLLAFVLRYNVFVEGKMNSNSKYNYSLRLKKIIFLSFLDQDQVIKQTQ
ncbi:uncharacterized protein LOC132065850 [Lycium ferocissimum]|uniref:uncharacterized protein LOC132065850 n=1 Tax=Lycium ferocissimum TaxID=112874 RepID=UPI00281681C5|nr:uncharacterized protein LOC132065850 [Lycium ferocissimum]